MADMKTKDPVLVVVQLSGGNDYLNTIIPYNNGLYQDYRPNIGIPQEDVIPIDDELGFNPNLPPLEGEVLGHGQDGPRPRSRLREGATAPTSAPWTSGTPPSPTRWAQRDGWAAPSARSIPGATTS